MTKVGVIALGWLGEQIAQKLISEFDTWGTFFESHEKSISSYFFDINTTKAQNLPEADIIILNLPPSKIKSLDRVIKLIKHYDESHIILISSTSVYAQGEHDEVDFKLSSSTRAVKSIEIEDIIVNHAKKHLIIRSAGQYGKDRHPGKYISGKVMKGGSSRVNLISGEALSLLIKRCVKEGTTGLVNAVNIHHPTKEDYYSEYCKRQGIDLPHFKGELPDKVVHTRYERFKVLEDLP